ncbi:MAG: translocation/assembly module TamB, partial [Acidobacteriaceae bacterium]
MSADEEQPNGEKLNSAGEQAGGETLLPAKRRRSIAWHVTRAGAWGIGGGLVLLIALVGGITWFTATAYFQRRVAREIVSVLGNATGGRVEVRGVQFSLWRLKIEVDGLVVHGTEGPGEAPYMAAEKVEVRVGISSFFSHATGAGLRSHVGLKLLRVERPQMHLMVDKDGKTNAPTPRHPSPSKGPVADTLLDMRAKEVALVDGVALVNDRAIPFDVAARDLDAEVHYLRATDRYGIALGVNDLRTRAEAQAEARSRLHFDAELGRDAVELKGLEFDSGAMSALHATGTLTHFAEPQWQGAVNGTLELKQLTVLTDAEGFTGGSVDLAMSGHSCAMRPVGTQTAKPRFWLRRRAGANAKASEATLVPVDSECREGYLLVGNAKLHKAGFVNEYVILHDVDGAARVHITPSELLLTEMNGILPGGGCAAGELRFADWLGDASHVTLTSTVTRIPLRTIMEVTETGGYGDLGFDTAVTGPVLVEWIQRPVNVAETVIVDGQLVFQPTGVSRKGALNNVPVNGVADARYEGKHEVVNIRHTTLQTPGSTTEASGVLGVEDGDRLTNLKVDTTIRDLGEFDQLLHTLGFAENGKQGAAAIPVALHGGVTFHGTAMGPAHDLDVKGHVQGSGIEVKLGSGLGIGEDTVVDSAVGDAEYSYDEGLAIANSTIRRGGAVLNVAGSLRPRKTVTRRGAADYLWDEGSSVEATLRLANAEAADVLHTAGQQKKIAVTGRIAANAQVRGTLDDLDGTGKILLARGTAYGEPYDSAAAELAVRGQEIDASSVLLMMHGARIAGEGGYDVRSGHLHGHIEGDNLVMSKFQTIAKTSPNADGTLTFVADANGTMEQPGLKATATLAGVKLDGKPLGEIAAQAHSEGSELFYTAQSTLVGAKVDATGETRLTGDYETQDRLEFSGFDVGTALELFMPGRMKAQSSIGGVVTVSGPLKKPTGLSGAAELSDFDVKLQGVELKAAEPLRVSLKNGIATLEQVHIVGQDTDMQASGTVQAFGATDPAGGRLDVKASGSVSLAIAHTFDPEILSSGRVEFTVAAGGRTGKPSLTGRVKF